MESRIIIPLEIEKISVTNENKHEEKLNSSIDFSKLESEDEINEDSESVFHFLLIGIFLFLAYLFQKEEE